MLQTKDVDRPSLDDWGSCGAACGRTCAGILVHDVLHRALLGAFPSWSTMLPPPARSQHADNIERMRAQAQKRAWRSRAFLTDSSKKLKCLVLNCVGSAVEHLSGGLQWRDSRGSGLLDVSIDSVGNPFAEARSRIYKMIRLSKVSVLGPIFAYYPESEHGIILKEIRTMGLDFASQVFWRFLRYSGFPYRFAQLVHSKLDEPARMRCRAEFYSLRPCCRTQEFCAKVGISQTGCHPNRGCSAAVPRLVADGGNIFAAAHHATT